MVIKRVDIWHLKLAFRFLCKHKLAAYQASENLVVKVTTDEEVRGFGEGIPREFVTGESFSASLEFLQEQLGPAVLGRKVASPAGLLTLVAGLLEGYPPETFPGAFCALETALLDAAGRTWCQPLSAFLGARKLDRLTYSAVLPLSSGPELLQFLTLVRKLGIKQVKLKVGEANDLETLALARQELGPEADLRVDANGAWTPAQAIARLQEMAPFRVSAVEQPVAKEDFQGLRQVQEAVPFPVIADESLCTLRDARELIESKACQIFNLRLSKVGGLTMALRLKKMAEAAGLRCQLGCHVGETSLLAAAGRHFAVTQGDLVYLEGSYAPFLLSQDVVQDQVSFGPQGLALPLTGPGLGVQVLESALDELAVSHISLS